jgi:hypothetical protein
MSWALLAISNIVNSSSTVINASADIVKMIEDDGLDNLCIFPHANLGIFLWEGEVNEDHDEPRFDGTHCELKGDEITKWIGKAP